MKKISLNRICILTILFLPILFVGCTSGNKKATNNGKAEFKVATYNIRYEGPEDEESGNGWDTRKVPLAKLILDHDLAIAGTQEGNDKQLGELKNMLPGYDYVGHPYGGPNGDLHNCATFFKTDLFELLDKGVFWYSETPGKKSIGWDATDLRICYWTKFKQRPSGTDFYFFNSHYSFGKSNIAKEESGFLMVRKIKEIAGNAPVISVGDFNSRPTSTQIAAIMELLSDAYNVSLTSPKGPEGTTVTNGFDGPPSKSRIDYIFVSSHFKVTGYEVLTDTYNNGRFPSDHLPVISILSFN